MSRLLALTSFRDRDLIEGALKAGAIGYLLKNVSAHDLAHAIREAHAGRSTLAPEAKDVLVRVAQQNTSQPDYRLSAREEEVLALPAEGLTNSEIAERLVIGVSTARFHVRSILAGWM